MISQPCKRELEVLHVREARSEPTSGNSRCLADKRLTTVPPGDTLKIMRMWLRIVNDNSDHGNSDHDNKSCVKEMFRG